MPVQKYDMRRPEAEGGGFEERYWSPVNYPVFGKGGAIEYIIHRVEDVTDFVLLRQKRAEELKATEELKTLAGRMETELFLRAREVDKANQDLRVLNEELGRSEKRFRELLEAAPDAIMEVDREGKITLVNQAAVRMFGHTPEELVGQEVENLVVPPSVRDLHRRHRADYARHPKVRPMASGLELSAQRKDGTIFPVEIGLSPHQTDGTANVIVMVHDITERKKVQEAMRTSEEKLRQAQKLEALARLAGGTAHEFNNLLTMVMGYAVLMLSALDSKDQLINYVEKIRYATTRAANLTRQLLAFSRQQTLAPRVLDLNGVLAEIWEVVQSVLGAAITTTFVPAAEPACVHADPSQIHQVIINLVTNARDAMPRGGTLQVEVSTAEMQDEQVRQHPGLVTGKYVVLSVSDTGSGMTADVQARLFEPFFSTKEFGKGSGLGLAAVYGIVQQEGGSVAVESSPGAGTTFRIFLPRVAEAEVSPAVADRSVPPMESLRGQETVLLVEDQQQLRLMTRQFLERLGYQVLDAAHADDAIRVATAFSGTIDLLLTDVVMPGLNGRELANRLKPIRPAMRVLYVSGYTHDAFVDSGIIDPNEAFMEKPFALEELAQRIREVLETAPLGQPKPQMLQ
jgi:hypothetical protein